MKQQWFRWVLKHKQEKKRGETLVLRPRGRSRETKEERELWGVLLLFLSSIKQVAAKFDGNSV